jgi:hypothetical protein
MRFRPRDEQARGQGSRSAAGNERQRSLQIQHEVARKRQELVRDNRRKLQQRKRELELRMKQELRDYERDLKQAMERELKSIEVALKRQASHQLNRVSRTLACHQANAAWEPARHARRRWSCPGLR